jgi:Sugar phosphate isomerases/epimerases
MMPEFPLGVQSYTFRKLGFEAAIDYSRSRGLNVIEAYPAHVPVGDKTKALMAKERGVRVASHGVNRLDQGSQDLFKFAKELELLLVVDPAPGSLAQLEEMASNYHVKLAIHNHGPTHRWGSALRTGEEITPYPHLGLCLDLGHLARSSEDPFKVVEKYGEKVFDVHLKDLDVEGEDVPLGSGVLKVWDFLKYLKGTALRPLLMVEYEAEPEDPYRGVDQSLALVRAVMR